MLSLPSQINGKLLWKFFFTIIYIALSFAVPHPQGAQPWITVLTAITQMNVYLVSVHQMAPPPTDVMELDVHLLMYTKKCSFYLLMYTKNERLVDLIG